VLQKKEKLDRILLVIMIPIILLLLFGGYVVYLKGQENIQPKINQGMIDLQTWDFAKDGPIFLNGKWEFYWNQFIEPQEIMKTAQLSPVHISVPGTWNDYQENGTKLLPTGFATYRLHVTTSGEPCPLAVKIGYITMAYRLYADGVELAHSGVAGQDAVSTKSGYIPALVEFTPKGNEFDLVLQVANFTYPRGGIRDSIQIGTYKQLEAGRNRSLAYQFLIAGGLLVMALYFLMMKYFNREYRGPAVFALLCMAVAGRTMLVHEVPVLMLIPDLSLEWRIYLNYFSGYLMLFALYQFVALTYPEEAWRKGWISVAIVTAVFIVFMIFLPIETFTRFTDAYYLILLTILGGCMLIAVKAVLRNRTGAELLLIGLVTLCIGIFNDMLYNMGVIIINANDLSSSGFHALLLFMAVLQAKNFAATNQRLKKSNLELLEADQLKDKIMATEMAFLQAQIKPHFLYNALSAIANVCEKDTPKAGGLIIDMAIYLRNSLAFNSLDKMTTLSKELEFVTTYINIEKARFGDKIKLKQEIEVPLDLQMPILVLQPLIENAIRHGISKKVGGGTISLGVKQVQEGILIEIVDDGVGMNAEKLAILLSEERIDQAVGLLNIHNRLQRLYGRGLEISSGVGLGTCVRLVIPEGRERI
jgi:two-component system LytT family sensor kinase